MIEYNHQKLINDYQLDVSKFPKELRMAVFSFLQLSQRKDIKEEALSLLFDLDKNLTVQLLNWISLHKDNLSEIICDACKYKQFYQIVFEVLIKGGFQEKHFYSHPEIMKGGEPVTYNLSPFPFQTHKFCIYFNFFAYGNLSDSSVRFIHSIDLKVCPHAKTIEPIGYSRPDNKTNYRVYNFVEGPEPNYEVKKMIDSLFNDFLNMLLSEKVIFIRKPVRNVIEQISIALNEEDHV